MNKLSIDKLSISYSGLIVIHGSLWIIISKPLFSFLYFFLAEYKLDGFIVFIIDVFELDFVFSEILEILFSLFVS